MNASRNIARTIIALLNDDNGVSLGQYEALLNLSHLLPDFGTPIFDAVEAVDDRYYIAEAEAEGLAELY